MDLNLDVLYLICEQFDNPNDLIRLAEVSEHFLPAIRHAFEEILANHPKIERLEVLDPGPNGVYFYGESRSRSFLKNFCSCFKKLEIGYVFTRNTEDIPKMNEFIDKYCTNTLAEVDIRSTILFDFDGMKQP